MDTTTTNLFDALLNRFPTWGFTLLLLLAFLMATVLAGYGLRMLVGLMALAQRPRTTR